MLRDPALVPIPGVGVAHRLSQHCWPRSMALVADPPVGPSTSSLWDDRAQRVPAAGEFWRRRDRKAISARRESHEIMEVFFRACSLFASIGVITVERRA
jgi:hypothetical protein